MELIFYVNLLSPAIFHDQYGQPSLKPLIKSDNSTWLEPARSFVKTVLIGGYNRKWGMPVPQVIAAKAGSVYVYAGTVPKALKLQGSLGERTKEGFGRYAVNYLVRKKWVRQFPEPGFGILLPDITLSFETIPEVQMKYPKAKLREILEASLQNLNIEGSQPSNAQLSNLMRAANSCRKSLHLSHLRTLLDGLGAKARMQYEKARVTRGLKDQGVSLISWIERLHQTPTEAPGLSTLTLNRIRQGDAELYVAELVEKLAKKTIKQRKTKGGLK